MKLRFSKMHGLGNDFMVIESVTQTVNFSSEQIIAWADRHTGVGFDQLLLIEPSDDPAFDFRYRIFNADGSEVYQCGNGARCITKFIVEKKLSDKKKLAVCTDDRAMALEYIDADHLRVSMGMPVWRASEIPMLSTYELGPFSLELDARVVDFSAVNVGNPHAVIEVHDINSAPVELLGSVLEKHEHFPEGVNVGFMQICSRDHIRLRVYERGTGETKACGSGACAAAVIGIAQQRLSSPVRVEQAGGDLLIRWDGNDKAIIMEGPATFVFDGVLAD